MEFGGAFGVAEFFFLPDPDPQQGCAVLPVLQYLPEGWLE